MADDSRTEKLLAMVLLHQMADATDQERIVALARAGFNNSEIADPTGKSTGTVGQQLYLARSKGPKKRVSQGRNSKK